MRRPHIDEGHVLTGPSHMGAGIAADRSDTNDRDPLAHLALATEFQVILPPISALEQLYGPDGQAGHGADSDRRSKGAVGFTPRAAIARHSAADNRAARHCPLRNRRMKMAAKHGSRAPGGLLPSEWSSL